MKKYCLSEASFLDPARYRICISGNLDEHWSDYCGGMAIIQLRDAKRSPMTILTGQLADQSALIGVLNSLHDIGYPILLVEYIGEG
jgi:hypothetical protein